MWKEWKGARDTFANQGGVLFGDLDGTQQQLDFLAADVGHATFFLGAKARSSDSQWSWRTLRNNTIRDKIIWHLGKKSQAERGHILMVVNFISTFWFVF